MWCGLSDWAARVEYVFDGCDEAGLLAVMGEAQRAERVAVARRVLAAGRLCQRRMAAAGAGEREQWCVDNWEAVAAEVAAQLGITRGRASALMNYGVELLDRLPRLAAVFAAGQADFAVITAVVFRTGLITDRAALAGIDAVLAPRVGRLAALSRRRVAEIIDAWVTHFDPAALRNARRAEAERHIRFGEPHDGMVQFWGALRATDAAVLDQRLTGLAATACRGDSRTQDQRRADALAALADGRTRLDCDCAAPDCTPVQRARGAVGITVLATAETLSGADDTPGHLPGYGAIPAEQVRALAARARLRRLPDPAHLRAEPRYQPSAALAEFVKARDLFCRFPGCDQPAQVCDIDHTVPWAAGGLTHPSNCKLLCRLHHLLKTFWTGPHGWRDTQHRDATITWTSPSGQTYTTTPGGTLLFPRLAVPTGAPTPPPAPPARPARERQPPVRERTRAAQRAARIAWERGLNQRRWAADPPPF